MKRFLTVFVIILTSVGLLSATQETYREDSREIATFRYLRMQSGTVTPEPTMPISGNQLLELLKDIEVLSLGDNDRKIYSELVEKLENASSNAAFIHEGYGAIDLDGAISPYGTVRFPGAETIREDLPYDYHNLTPLASVSAMAWGNDFIAGKASLDIYMAFFTDAMVNSTKFLSNFTGKLDASFPYEAWASIGNDTFNFTIGRDRVSAGNGMTGNLSVGANFLYQNFAKISYVNPRISYDVTLMAFDNNLSDSTYDEYQRAICCVYTDFTGNSTMVANHRLSCKLSNSLAVTLFEGMLEYGDNMLDIRLLSPLMIFHNYNSFFGNNNNNYCGVELEAALPGKHDLTCQMFLDQFQFSFETEAAQKAPNAYGFLLNVAKGYSFDDCFGDVCLELVYTSPCLYLKAKDYFDENEFNYYETDLLVGYRLGPFTDSNYLGYKYGPDSIVVSLGGTLTGNRFTAKSNLTYRIHGVYRMGDPIDPDFVNHSILTPYLTEGKVAEHDIIVKTDGTFEVSESVSVSGAVGMMLYLNKGNIAGEKLFDTQFTLGLTLKPQNFSFWK